ncbi:bryoporin-like [Plectropomus leopardus]|uniref:bryoporin-like n=1 Tax=Plectropomus leopardus TaxID=160734 RepID=UPI001C4DA338|nr:bryoporin-like [Plectropomus leopardus]
MPKLTKIANRITAAADVVDAAISVGGQAAELFPTHHQCSIDRINKSSNYTLCNPSVYIESGFCTQPLPPSIDPTSPGSALFTKTAKTARGAVGVFTYDLLDKSTKESTEKIAVMFSVPYDFNLYSNWYAVGIFDKSKECNHDLNYQMYTNTHHMLTRKKAGLSVSHSKDRVAIMVSMTDSYQPVMKVEVKDG